MGYEGLTTEPNPGGAMGPLGQPTHWVGSHGTAGGEYGREEGSQGVGPPCPPPLTLGFILVSFTGKFTNILGLVCLAIGHCVSHVLPRNNLTRLPIFLGDSLLSRNHKRQIGAHVEGKSVALLSGIMEASYRHFFIGQGFNCSRSRFRCLSTGFKNWH